jgi:uncharacterized protein YjlB
VWQRRLWDLHLVHWRAMCVLCVVVGVAVVIVGDWTGSALVAAGLLLWIWVSRLDINTRRQS